MLIVTTYAFWKRLYFMNIVELSEQVASKLHYSLSAEICTQVNGLVYIQGFYLFILTE